MDTYTITTNHRGKMSSRGGLTKQEAVDALNMFLMQHKPNMWISATVVNNTTGVGAQFWRNITGDGFRKVML